MGNNNKSLFEQITEIIKQIKNSEINNEENSKRKFIELKRLFNMLRERQKMDNDGKVKESIIVDLSTQLVELRKQGYEDEENLNEILQIIADEAMEKGETETAKDIHTKILGYKGTKCSNMSPEYIEEIIKRKIKNETCISTDITNMLLESFESIYLVSDFERYQELIDNAIIPLTSVENNDLEDKRIITVLNRLIKEYKVRGDYGKAFELSSRGVKLKQFENSDEYKELLEESESLRLYLSLEKNFRKVNIDLKDKPLVEAIREALGREGIIDVETGGGDIFLKGKREGKGEEGQTSKAYKMPTEEKLIAIERLLGEIQKEVPNATVTEIKVSKEGTFKGYVIIPITNTNITILENMNDNINEAIFIADNSKIEKIIGKMTKQQAKSQKGVESANHSEEFESYAKRLIKKTKKILKYPEKQAKKEGVKRKSKEWYERFKTPNRKRNNRIGDLINMRNLPMSIKNNWFLKIKTVLKNLFNKKSTSEKSECNNENETIINKRSFQDNIKINNVEDDVLTKIQMQNKKNVLLEKIAENPELLDELSMDELIALEDMYDEELRKMKK